MYEIHVLIINIMRLQLIFIPFCYVCFSLSSRESVSLWCRFQASVPEHIPLRSDFISDLNWNTLK